MAEPITKDSLIVDWRPPSRLFLYGLQATGPLFKPYSAAAIGLLYSDVLDIAHVYPPGTFDVWNLGVHCAARGGTPWLLFLDLDGRVATGTIDADFGFVQAKAYPAGSYNTDYWYQVAVDGNGDLLMTSAGNGGPPTRYAVGQVEPDGTFIEWQGEVALPAPYRLVGLSQVHAWLTTSADPLVPSLTGTSTVSLLHRGSVVGSRTWSEIWTGMAGHGDLLAVYHGERQVPVSPTETDVIAPHYEVCRISPDNQITTVWDYDNIPNTLDGPIPVEVIPGGTDIDTPSGLLLFYQFAIGSNVAEVRSLTELGFARTARLGQLRQIPDNAQGWLSIAPCSASFDTYQELVHP